MSLMEGWSKVATVPTQQEADVISGLLDDSGIPSITQKAEGAPGAWLTGTENPFGPIDVLVPEQHGPAARDLLAPAVAAGAEREQIPARRAVVVVIAAAVLLIAVGGIVAALLIDISG